MILAIQKQDQKEEEEMKQRLRQTDEASLAAIEAIQRQDAGSDARSRQLQEELRRQMLLKLRSVHAHDNFKRSKEEKVRTRS